MKLNTLLLISALPILVSCTSAPYKEYNEQKQSEFLAQKQSSAGETNARNFKDTWDKGIAKANNCIEQSTKDPSSLLVSKEILFVKLDSPNKIELMSSTAKITPTQSKALLASTQVSTPCRQEILEIFTSYPQIRAVYANYYGNLDIIYADLLSKRTTIGEANKQKALLLEKVTTERATVAKSIYDGFLNQDTRERQVYAQPTQPSNGLILVAPTNNPINLAPFMTNPSSAIVRGNTQPFQQPAPQLPIQNPSVNCNPNGVGGFRCQ
jgi:hypothetical protein